MTETTSTLADQLLEAHVRHELNALKGAKLKKFLHQEVDELLEYANSVTLERVWSVPSRLWA